MQTLTVAIGTLQLKSLDEVVSAFLCRKKAEMRSRGALDGQTAGSGVNKNVRKSRR